MKISQVFFLQIGYRMCIYVVVVVCLLGKYCMLLTVHVDRVEPKERK